MARPYKENLDYFPLETTNNFETKTILLRYQSFGFAALIIIKQLIFNNSFFIKYDQNFIDMIAMELHLTEKKDLDNLKRLLEHLLEREYFDKEMFKKYGILTNAEIQK